MAQKSALPRVLVVDDETLIRWSLRRALVALGCDVSEAFDASSALLAAKTPERFDAILLDLKLPDSDDLTLLSRLRGALPGARIVLMTAFGTQDTEIEALARGASQVVRKPFDVKALAALVVESHRTEGTPPR